MGFKNLILVRSKNILIILANMLPKLCVDKI